jgi:hypothetical protein
MPKQIGTATMEGARKGGRARKRWAYEVQGDLNIMGINKRKKMVRNHGGCRKIVLEAKVHNLLWHLNRRRREEEEEQEEEEVKEEEKQKEEEEEEEEE